MRLLILSDIHSNVTALEAIERDAGPVDAMYCAGDYVDDGTNPHEAIQWVQAHGVQCVIGNHDQYLLNIAATGEAKSVKGTRQWRWVHDNIEKMKPVDFAFLRALPTHISFFADGIDYIMRHQMIDNSYAMPETAEQFDGCWRRWGGGDTEEKRLIFGHIHRRCIHQLDDHKLWLNPGSVSYRRQDEQDKRAHYMLITDGRITFHAVAYDRSKMYAQALDYERKGTMAEDQIEAAKFFFGPMENENGRQVIS